MLLLVPGFRTLGLPLEVRNSVLILRFRAYNECTATFSRTRAFARSINARCFKDNVVNLFLRSEH